MLDIELFRADKGGNPEIIRESQRRRFADVTLVDKVIEADNVWRKLRGRVDILRKYQGFVSKTVAKKMKEKENPGDANEALPPNFANKDQDGNYLDALLSDKAKVDVELAKLTVEQLKKVSKDIAQIIDEAEVRLFELEKKRDKTLCLIGNLVHETCVISDNEDNNGIVRTFEGAAKALLAEKQKDLKLLNHVDIMKKLGNMDCEQGAMIAGNRGYFLTGNLVRLNLALIQYSIDFLTKRGYTAIYPPYFMMKDMMAEVAQLEQFDEELYKVTGEGDDKYLIATSEQPIVAYHKDKWFDEKQLPLKWVGYSACFRKEVGSHGRDTLGIFRVHQFEKIEQFVVCTPKEQKSWEAMDLMIKNSEDFYQTLGLTYQVVNIVSGKLNNAAAKKLDLEAWFPASKTHRELVSCSNCTDYQARRVNSRFGQSKKAEGGSKEYVHMLNSTLCATTRVMCCIVENYQTKEGIIVPEVLRPYMGGVELMPYPQEQQQKKK